MQMCVARACQDMTWDPPCDLVLCSLMPSRPLSTLLLQLLPSGQTSSELSTAITFFQGSVFLMVCVYVCVCVSVSVCVCSLCIHFQFTLPCQVAVELWKTQTHFVVAP